MATATQSISLEEYMRTSYSPDREYIDGEILERNVGKGKHSYTQGKTYAKLSDSLEGLFVLPEQRIQVTATRVRVPDVCVIKELVDTVMEPPLLCVEVLSPEDRWSRTNSLISDYHNMGVPCVWVIDPWSSQAWIFDLDKPPREVLDGKLVAQALNLEIQLRDVLPPSSA